MKSERQNVYHIYWSLSRQLSRKKFLLVVCKILRLSVTTLTADDKYSLVNKDNLTEVIQILLSEKQKAFFHFFFFFCIFLLQSERENVCHIYWSLWRQLSWKKSLLVIFKILRLFANTLTSDCKYFLLNRDNLMEPIKILLSEKQKALLQFFLHFANLN